MRRDLLRFFSSLSLLPRRSRRARWPVWAGTLALGAMAGAGSVALFGPGGRRRRHLIQDRVQRSLHDASHGADMAVHDLRHRARGIAAEARHAVRADAAPNHVVLERARATLGHVCSHPHGVHIAIDDGVLEVTGPMLADEHARVLRALRRVHGVRDVRDRLEVTTAPGRVPALQGSGHRQGGTSSRWAPSTRLLAMTAGVALMVWGALTRASRKRSGAAAAVAGGLLVARAAANRDARAFLGVGVRASDLPRRGVQVQKTLHVRAPIEEVYARFAQLESFPRFMAHVKEVQRVPDSTGAQRFRWRVEGPLGIPAEWEAVVTEVEANRLIAWRSIDGSMVDNVGSMRFERNDDGSTRMTLHLAYEPPVGAVGHAIARLFGRDPKRLLDDDLLRFQSLIETGHATGRAGQVGLNEVEGRGRAVH